MIRRNRSVTKSAMRFHCAGKTDNGIIEIDHSVMVHYGVLKVSRSLDKVYQGVKANVSLGFY